METIILGRAQPTGCAYENLQAFRMFPLKADEPCQYQGQNKSQSKFPLVICKRAIPPQ